MSTEAMLPSRIFASLPLGHPDRDAAIEALRDRLWQLSARSLSHSAREDVVHSALAKLLDRSAVAPIAIENQDEGSYVNYMKRVLMSVVADEGRRQSALAPELPIEGTGSPSVPPDQEDPDRRERDEIREEEILRGRLLELFEMALRRATRPGKRTAEADTRAFAQIRALNFEGGSMSEMMARDERITPQSSEEDRKLARDRILTAHSRCRKRLLAAIDELEEEHVLSALDAARARRGVNEYLDRRTRKLSDGGDSAVPTGGGRTP